MRLSETFPGEEGKERIITAYLNEIFYGHGAYGVAAAAQIYFGVSDLAELTPAQAALLAGAAQVALDPRSVPLRRVKDDEGPAGRAGRTLRRSSAATGSSTGSAEGARWTKLTQTELAAALRRAGRPRRRPGADLQGGPFHLAGPPPARRRSSATPRRSRPAATGSSRRSTWKAQDLAEKWLTAGAIVPNVSRKTGDALLKSLKIPQGRPRRGSGRCAARTCTTARWSPSTTGPATCSPTPAAPATTATT